MPSQPEELAIGPDLPIIDSHHHLRYRPGDSYLFPEFCVDLARGHRIVATIAVECGEMYRTGGPTPFRPIGETEFIEGISAMFASGQYGDVKACAGIVAYADLRLGPAVAEVIQAQAEAAGGRLRGIRNPVSWHSDSVLRKTRTAEAAEIMADAQFRSGFEQLEEFGLSFDAWVYHSQLLELFELARAFPRTSIVANHVGGPLGIGPFAGRRAEVFGEWRGRMMTLSQLPNVFVKLGGLGLPAMGFGFDTRGVAASSAELAEAWRPYIETCVDLFGPARCMFESNYPSDRVTANFVVIWNALKRIGCQYGQQEQAALFHDTARAVYRITDAVPMLASAEKK